MSDHPETWTRLRLGEVAHVVHGWPFKGEGFAPDTRGLPIVVAIGNFDYAGGFRFANSSIKRYKDDYPLEYELAPGDLLLVMTCQTEGGEILGVPAQIPDDGRTYLHNQRLGKLVIDRPDLLDSDFAYQMARTSEFNRQLFVTATGSKILHTSPTRIEASTFLCPPLEEQQRIAAILGALDDKIASNLRLARTAMDLADSTFMHQVLCAELEEHAISELARTVLGGTPSRDNSDYWSNGTVAWLNSGKANEERIIQPSGYITAEALARSSAKLMPVGSTVIAITGATLGQVARLGIEASGNQSLVGIWAEDESMNDWLYFAIRSRVPELLKKATGAAQQHVNKRDVDCLAVPVLPASELSAFAATTRPLLKAATAADMENVVLAATRDALLPQLMSGKLRVKDAEKVFEDAGV